MKSNIFILFIQELLSLPLWVKQVILVYLRKDLESYLSDDLITTNEQEIYHIYRPVITKLGMDELDKKNQEYDESVYKFLYDCANNVSILEMSIENQYSMEDISKIFVLCYEKNYIKQNMSENIVALALFIAGKIMTGEYFKRIGKITVDQVNTILKQQDEQKRNNLQHTKFAELMVENNFVERKDITSLIKLKEEAQRKTMLDFLYDYKK